MNTQVFLLFSALWEMEIDSFCLDFNSVKGVCILGGFLLSHIQSFYVYVITSQNS